MKKEFVLLVEMGHIQSYVNAANAVGSFLRDVRYAAKVTVSTWRRVNSVYNR